MKAVIVVIFLFLLILYPSTGVSDTVLLLLLFDRLLPCIVVWGFQDTLFDLIIHYYAVKEIASNATISFDTHDMADYIDLFVTVVVSSSSSFFLSFFLSFFHSFIHSFIHSFFLYSFFLSFFPFVFYFLCQCIVW